MSQENVEGLRQALDAFNRRDRAAWLTLCDPGVENVPPRDWPESDPIRGREAVWDFYVEGNEPWEASPLEHGEIIDVADDKIAAQVRGEMRGRASGAGVPWSFWQVVTIRYGKLLRVEWFAERAEALEAVGLGESTIPQDNAEVVYRQFAAFERGGLDAVAKFWHPEIEWRAVEGAADDVGVMRGHDALRRYYQDWIDTMEDLRADVEETLLQANEQVVVVVRNSGRGRTSGVLTAGRYYVACTVRDGQIVSGREYETREQALVAVGLRE